MITPEISGHNGGHEVFLKTLTCMQEINSLIIKTSGEVDEPIKCLPSLSGRKTEGQARGSTRREIEIILIEGRDGT